MKDKLFELFETNGELQIDTVALHISMAAVLGFLIFVSYYIKFIICIFFYIIAHIIIITLFFKIGRFINK